MDKLKELLGDLYAQVAARLGDTKLLIDDGSFIKRDDANWIPKHRFDEVNTAKKAAEDLAREQDARLKDFAEKVKGNEALSAQVTELQRANKAAKDEHEAKQLRLRKEIAVEKSLMENGVGSPTARGLLTKSIDIDKVELDEAGKPKGIDAILKPIKEDKAFAGMFGTTVIVGQEHNDGGGNGAGDFYTREQVKAMSQEQVNANLKKVNASMAQWK